jgi:hypothetical protein
VDNVVVAEVRSCRSSCSTDVLSARDQSFDIGTVPLDDIIHEIEPSLPG